MKRLTLYLPTEVKGREGFSEVGEGVTVGLTYFPSWGVQSVEQKGRKWKSSYR